jgi:hypothetical protein
VTHNPSRKQFVARLLGVVAAASVLPRLRVKPAEAGTTEATSSAKAPRGFEIRHDARAIARRDTL